MFDRSKRFDQELEQKFTDGEVIVREGDESRDLYVIVEGAAEVTKNVGGKDVVLTTLRKGDFFGEMSLLEAVPRSATVRSLGKTKMSVLKPGGLLLKMRRDPTFAFEMLQQLSARVRRVDEKLVMVLKAGKFSAEQLDEIISEIEFENAGRDKK